MGEKEREGSEAKGQDWTSLLSQLFAAFQTQFVYFVVVRSTLSVFVLVLFSVCFLQVSFLGKVHTAISAPATFETNISVTNPTPFFS